MKLRRPRKRNQRRAAATVEFAICLPALVVLTLGTIDLCSMLFLKESVTLAAYEGARQGVGRGQTNADCIDRVIDFLDARGVDYDVASLVTVSSPGFGGADTLENVTVTVSVPCAGNLIVPSVMFGGMNMTSSVTMRKEYQNLPSS